MGRDSESSAQSRQAGTGVKQSGAGLEGGEMRDRVHETVTAGGSDMVAAAKGVEYGKTAHFQGTWGKLGGWDRFWRCPEGSRGAFCCSRAVVCGSKQGRAENSAVVDKCVDHDVASALGVSCSTGSWGTSWGVQGGTGGCRSCHRRRWDWQKSSVG